MTDREQKPDLDVLKQIESSLDELIAWINTDYTGCVAVEQRGTAALRLVRELLRDAEESQA